MKRNGLNVMGKIAIVASFFLVGLAGNVSAQETGFVEMPIREYAIVSQGLGFDGNTTIEFWRRGGPQGIMACNKSGAIGGFLFGFEGDSRLTVVEYKPNPSRKEWLNPGVTADTDLWYHHALVITARGYIQLYTNGVLKAQVTTVDGGEFDFANGSTALWIGDAEWATRNVPGNQSFADFRVWSCARTATEIADNYRLQVASTTTDLKLNYTFAEQTGNTVANLVNSANGTIKDNTAEGRTHSWGKIGVIPTGLSSSEQGTISTTLSWTAGADNKWEVEVTSNDVTWTLMETGVPSFGLNGISSTNCKARVRTSWPLVSAWSDEIVINGTATGLADAKTYNAAFSYQNGAISLRKLEGNNDILVYNATGALTHQFKATGTNFNIDATSWNSGVYFLKLTNGVNSKTFKVVL